jgi:hypothetical protein
MYRGLVVGNTSCTFPPEAIADLHHTCPEFRRVRCA